MYDKKLRGWRAPSCDETLLKECRDPANQEDPNANFLLADYLLSQGSRGKETAQAVYRMEKAAKADHPAAAYAMGQMFQYGWAVHKNLKTARQWYEKAQTLGYGAAAEALAELKRRRRRNLGGAVLVAAVVLGLAAALFWMPSDPVGIRVHEDTELIETTTVEAFTAALNEVISAHDGPLVVSGAQSTNRLMLQFDGAGIDLSAFPAVTVIADEENFVILQFETEEDAKKCLEALQKNGQVLYVEMDEYDIRIEESPVTAPQTAVKQSVSSQGYHSNINGRDYQTWGATFLGMDQLETWIQGQNPQAVTVAVLDTGSEPWPKFQDRMLEGADMLGQVSNGWQDQDGHGSHVAGTILDCTQGLDVKILPVRVLGPYGSPASIIVMGLKYAIEQDVDVINMSLGGGADLDANGVCQSPKDHYIQEALNRGISVVVSAGNGDTYGNPVDTADHCPAHIEGCIVVAACDSQLNSASFSNYGYSVDVSAPGVDVMSYMPDGVGPLSGTSMAAPHVSALVAMLKTYLPDRTPYQLEKYIGQFSLLPGDPLFFGEGVPWAAYFAGE